MIDHSLLKPTLTREDTLQGLEVAMRENVASATIKQCYTKLAADVLKGSGVMVNPVICFPMGYAATETKVFATRQSIDEGAEEIDMVLNLGALFGGEYQFVQDDIAAVVEAAQGRTVKVILETGYYKDLDLIVKACQLIEAGVGVSSRPAAVLPPPHTRTNTARRLGILLTSYDSCGNQLATKCSQGRARRAPAARSPGSDRDRRDPLWRQPDGRINEGIRRNLRIVSFSTLL